MTRDHLLLVINAFLATATTALFVTQGSTLCVLIAVISAVAALRCYDRLSARP